MIATLRESKARLSEFVALAQSGEEVLITVHGRPRAKLVPVAEESADMESWLEELAKLRLEVGKKGSKRLLPSVLDEIREERW